MLNRFTGKSRIRRAVTLAAARLGISELELFQLAYRGWFKRPCDPDEISRALETYRSQGRLPHWCEHYLYQVDARIHFMGRKRFRVGFPWLLVWLLVTAALSSLPRSLQPPKNAGTGVLVC